LIGRLVTGEWPFRDQEHLQQILANLKSALFP